jgi:hypothetical protein
LGSVGGLVIPTARSLGDGTVALGWSTAREPQLYHQGRHHNALLGVGLAPGLDIVGRFADYAPHDERDFVSGDGRDISVNLKYAFPVPALWGLPTRVGVSLHDPAGGKVHFRSLHAVATVEGDAWTASVGLGRSNGIAAPGARLALDGLFAGVDYLFAAAPRAGQWRLAAEHDARQPLLGLRWTSAPLTPGSRLTLHGAAMRSFAAGAAPGATALTLGLTMAFGEQERRLEQAASQPPRALESTPEQVPAAQSPLARLGALRQRLIAVGLERVRVGRLDDRTWVVAYQNRRFGHHELDALGIVVGLAAQAAPAEVPALLVLAEKTAQPALTFRTDPGAWRGFLAGGSPEVARRATQVTRASALNEYEVDWLSDAPGPASLLQLQLVPQVNLNVGTEYGAYEYSVALQWLASVPLWRGAQLIASAQQRVAASDQASPWGAFPDLLHPEGLRAFILHQSLWLADLAYVGGGIGRFEYGALGAEGEAMLFVPGRDDVIRVRGRQLQLLPEMPLGADLQQWLSYRWALTPSTWVEAGWQRYSDLGTGPLLTVSRWWRDVGVHLNYRSSRGRKFAGLELSFPLTPQVGPATGAVHLSGPSQWRRGQRTRLTDGANANNWIEPNAAREYSPAWNLETQVFYGGRLGPAYVLQNVPRLREAFERLASPGTHPRPSSTPAKGGSP